MLSTALIVGAGFLIASNVSGLHRRLALAVLVGALIRAVFVLGMAEVELADGIGALGQAAGEVVMAAVVCMLCTWGFSRLRI